MLRFPPPPVPVEGIQFGGSPTSIHSNESNEDEYQPIQLTFRERINRVYFYVFSRGANAILIGLSLLLLAISMFASSSVTQSLPYHFLEGVLTFLFVTEVVMRCLATNAPCWLSVWGAVEAFLCVACVVAFCAVSALRDPSREEHMVIVMLRLLAQGGRVIVLWLKRAKMFVGVEPIRMLPTGVLTSVV